MTGQSESQTACSTTNVKDFGLWFDKCLYLPKQLILIGCDNSIVEPSIIPMGFILSHCIALFSIALPIEIYFYIVLIINNIQFKYFVLKYLPIHFYLQLLNVSTINCRF